MALNITPEERERWEQFVKDHPIDPSYDEECEYFDGNVPAEQLLARDLKELLDQNPE